MAGRTDGGLAVRDLIRAMGDERVMTEVTCYAGARYAERPRAFLFGEERLEVVEVERRERTPRALRFPVRVADRRRFRLVYDEGKDAWGVRPGRSCVRQRDAT